MQFAAKDSYKVRMLFIGNVDPGRPVIQFVEELIERLFKQICIQQNLRIPGRRQQRFIDRHRPPIRGEER